MQLWPVSVGDTAEDVLECKLAICTLVIAYSPNVGNESAKQAIRSHYAPTSAQVVSGGSDGRTDCVGCDEVSLKQLPRLNRFQFSMGRSRPRGSSGVGLRGRRLRFSRRVNCVPIFYSLE
jgi:hypothetical protein